VEFKLQLVANQNEIEVFANCSMLTVLSRLKNCVALATSVIDDKPVLEDRILAIEHVLEQMEEMRTRLVNQYEILADVSVLLEEQASDDDKQLELDLGD
jgi:hypothetical protein